MLKSEEKTEKELLEYFFEFVNFDLTVLDFDNLIVVAMAYVRFAYSEDTRQSKDKYEGLTSPVFDRDENGLEKITAFLEELQKHLKNILNRIMDPKDLKLSLRQEGRRLIVKTKTGFEQKFHIQNQPSRELDANKEIPFAESVFTDIIVNAQLLPEKFNKCDECGNYFYQKTKREMRFCSKKCSNANRQRNFQASRGIAVTAPTFSKEELKNINDPKRRKQFMKKKK